MTGKDRGKTKKTQQELRAGGEEGVGNTPPPPPPPRTQRRHEEVDHQRQGSDGSEQRHRRESKRHEIQDCPQHHTHAAQNPNRMATHGGGFGFHGGLLFCELFTGQNVLTRCRIMPPLFDFPHALFLFGHAIVGQLEHVDA
jgi:hypothetical protein